MAIVAVVLGRDLSEAEIRLINRCREQEFHSERQIKPAPDNDDWLKPYFLVRDFGEVVAFGRLHTIRVEFREELYEILGVASIVAISKGKGYGRDLMRGIVKYVRESGKSAVGFCEPNVSVFYEKCGFTLLRRGSRRFVFVEVGTRKATAHPDDDVLFLDGADGLMRAVRRYPVDKIIAYKHSW
jgi:GNAT superfamily N-acetyltransferase